MLARPKKDTKPQTNEYTSLQFSLFHLKNTGWRLIDKYMADQKTYDS